ncbi:MAG: DNA methylase [Chloroflexi bacterium]|nr:DNA methylase [Chloroflexota bacterium]
MALRITTPVRVRKRLNDLEGREWLPLSKSVWSQRGLGKDHEEAYYEKLHPAPFSFSDVAKLISFFTRAGEAVLDPFVGVASTLKACAVTGRTGVGIELSEEWSKLGKERLTKEIGPRHGQRLITGDARRVLKRLPPESFAYVVTSPPYWGILNKKADHKTKQERVDKGLKTNYGSDVRDFGNIPDYATFLSELRGLLLSAAGLLEPKRYMSIIVSDFRHGGTYYDFHADLTKELERDSGLSLQGITILTQNAKRLFPYGYPAAYVPNVHHQYILNFRKLT